MANKVNFLPADYYDDMTDAYGLKANARRQARIKKNIANSNKINWEEKYDWLLSREELIAFDSIKTNFSNSKLIKSIL
jgi:hypothetical protein